MNPTESSEVSLTQDWICEVLSSSTAKDDRTIKMPLYAQHRTGHLWLVDPLLKTLEAYELRQEKWSLLTVLKDDDQVRIAPFDTIEFSLSVLWA